MPKLGLLSFLSYEGKTNGKGDYHPIITFAMVLLIIFLSNATINFLYVNMTYVYVTELTLADPT